MVRSSFSILFFIRDSRVKKDGTVSIEVQLSLNGDRCAFSTGKRVTEEEFNTQKSKILNS